jgi:phage anti-repressor protein
MVKTLEKTPCVNCGRVFLNLSKHIKCSKKPNVITTNENVEYKKPQKEPENTNKINKQDTKLVVFIKSKLRVKSDWSSTQVDECVNYIVESLKMEESKTLYPVKLDELYKMLEYYEMRKIKDLLINNFDEKIDYNLLPKKDKQDIEKTNSEHKGCNVELNKCENNILSVKKDKQNLEKTKSKHGGHNKKDYVLTLSCAKRLCMLSQTKKAKIFRMYFVMVEEIFKECLKDNTNKLMSEFRDIVLNKIPLVKKILPLDVSVNNIKMINSNKNISVVYIIKLLDYNSTGQYYKYGITTNILERMNSHERTFGSIEIIHVFDMHKSTQLKIKEVENGITKLCKNIGVYENLELEGKNKQIETFKLINENESDIIEAINKCLNITPDVVIELDNIKDNDHEYKMLLVQLEMKKIELEIKKIELEITKLRID